MPTPESLFIQAVDEGVYRETAFDLLRLLQKTAGLDVSKRVGEDGRNLLEQWWFHTQGGGYRKRPEAHQFTFFERDCPTLWSNPDRRGQRFATRILKDLLESHDVHDKETAAWLAVLPQKDLEAYRDGFGTPLMSRILGAKAPLCVDVLIQRGWRWTGTEMGRPIAMRIQTASQWEAFLSQGGNPAMIVKAEDDRDVLHDVVLWKKLRPHATDDLRASIEAWAKANDASSLKRETDAAYWAQVRGKYSASDVQSAVRSEKDWHEKRDEKGRNVLMVVSERHNPAFVNFMKTPKTWSGSAALLPDDEGRTLWTYVLGANRTENEVVSLLKERLKPRASDRGWLHECFLSSKPFSEHEAFRQSTNGSKWEALVKEDPSLLWGSNPTAQNEFVNWALGQAYWGSKPGDPSSLAKKLAHWAVTCPPKEATPSLRGLLVFADAVVLNGRNREAIVGAFEGAPVSFGATWNAALKATAQGTFNDTTSLKLFAAVSDENRAWFEAAFLNAQLTVGLETSGSTRPRVRM